MEMDFNGFGFLLMRWEVIDAVGLSGFAPIVGPDGTMVVDDDGVIFCDKAKAAGYATYLHSGVYSPHLKLLPISPVAQRKEVEVYAAPIQQSAS
jgi:hypothetical protein